MWSGGGARPQFVEQPHVLDRDHRLIGKIRDQLNLLAAERSDFLAVDAEQGEADFKMSLGPLLARLGHLKAFYCAGNTPSCLSTSALSK